MISRSLFFSPNAPCYAVIRMDPVAMVKKLDDPEALKAARAMAPQSYVVYLTHVIRQLTSSHVLYFVLIKACLQEPELPFPNKPWYRYELNVIAPSLCEEDAARGITADMCTPIYPNNKHPAGREPLRPEKPFPYTNCYHWCNALEIEIRVLPRPELFNEDQAIQLSYDEQMRFASHQFEDLLRSRRSLSFSTEPPPPPLPLQRTETEPPVPAGATDPSARKPPSVTSASSRSSFGSSASRSVMSEESDMNSVDEIMAMDIFTGPNADLDLLPLCELWLDMAVQLKEEDIPSPAGFLKERDEIVKYVVDPFALVAYLYARRIIQEARVRAYAASNANVPSSVRGTRAGGAGTQAIGLQAPKIRRHRECSRFDNVVRVANEFGCWCDLQVSGRVRYGAT
ncbi:hypothetical protein TRAPUB_715 [Trametes pubescens]|uniref:Uncharacterized protein n=1 Tax=Trametes pubescens TaxID=154538 RepID=A0A1M2VLE4_TRAPU|nr:hypothetical protein TRAPUB_715 [Trametes pubescens]